MTLTPEILDLEETVKMDFSSKMDGSSDWSGRRSRSRDSSTSMSESDKREQVDELKAMIQTLVMGFKTPLQQQLLPEVRWRQWVKKSRRKLLM